MVSESEVIPRLVTAIGIGAAIGLERQLRHQVAGLRTHTLVTLACALVMGVSELLHNQVPLATGILSGVGSIGAGAVIRTEASVSGLATAGTVWMCAALGVAVGAGFYLLGITSAVLALLSVEVLGWLERGVAHGDTQSRLHEQEETMRRQAQSAHPPSTAPAPEQGTGHDGLVERPRERWWRWRD
jgi:putative Mg2+ transporter-C (MgtC) family protein